MRKTFLGILAAGALSAQSVGGPVLGYVVDGESRLRSLNGIAAAAHVGAAVREQVRDSWGALALLTDGTALRNGVTLDGRWASVHPGAFLDSAAREVLVAADDSTPWQLTLPLPALSVRVSPSGDRVATMLADESVAVWSRGGKAEFRLPASKWWSLAFAADRLLAYDPAANAIVQLDGANGPSTVRKFDGPGARYDLAIANSTAILLGERLLLAPLAGGDVRELTPPDGAQRLEAMQGGKVFLLTHDPARPMWLLDRAREDGLLVIPAVANENGGRAVRIRLAALLLRTAGLAIAGPDGACTISPANILSPQSKVTLGVATTITVSTSGCTTPLRAVQIASGTLPPGLALTPTTTGAEISGTPTAAGVYSFTLRAVDSAYKLPNESVIIQVNAPLSIDTPAAATGSPSAAYTDTIRARGGAAPYTFSIVGEALPAGLTLNASTGTITGTMPATGSTFRVRVTDSSTPANTAEKSYTIAATGLVTTVAAPPVGSTGTAYTFDIDGALGTSGFAVALGALPPGLAIDANGVITGTPTTVGEYHFTVRQTVSAASVWRSFRIFINSAATISGTPRAAEELASYNHVFTVAGGVAPYTFALAVGTLPTGLSLNAATGAITGTLAAGVPGTAFTVTATDASGRVYSLPTSIATVTRLTGTAGTVLTIRVPNSATANPYSLSGGGPGREFTLIGGPGAQQIAVDPVNGTVDYSFAAPGIYFPAVLATDSLGGAIVFNTVQYKAIGNLALTTSTEAPNGQVGVPYSAFLPFRNGDFGPLNFAVTSGTLPAGLTLNATTGLISGTPESGIAGVTFPFQVTLTDITGQTAVADYFIGIGGSARITTTKVADGTVGTDLSTQITQLGGSSPVFSNPGGGLPPGVTLSATGLISGIPTTPGDYTFLIRIFDPATSDQDTKQYTVHVATAPTFTIAPPTLFEATLYSNLDLPITQSGGRAPSTLSITGGGLPDGLFLAANGTTLSISGTPMVEGSQSFSILISDADGRIGSIPYTINVRKSVRFTAASLPPATRTVAYSTTVGVSGGIAPYTYSLSGGFLPAGLTLSPAGLLQGTPTVSGSFLFGVFVTDNFGRATEQNFTLEVADPIVITNSVPLPPGQFQTAYSTPITATGGAATRTYSIAANDLAPLLSINASTGVISGLPLLAGTYPFTVQVQDNQGRLATQAQQVTIQSGLSFTPATVPNGAVGTPYSVTFNPVNAIGSVTWSVSAGSLPPGVTLGAATGVLSGTPTTAGPFSFTVQAVDATLVPVTQNYSMTVLNVLTLSPATLPNATINTAYSQQLTASGATGAVAWAVTTGALPAGLTLGPTSGAITGTPTVSGNFSFTVTATDSLTQTGSRAYTLTVLNVLTIAPATLPNATINAAYSQQLTASGATGAVTWAVTAGALPAGLTLVPSTGAISGSPTAAGTFIFTATATDSLTQTGSRAYSLTVLNVLTISPTSLPNATNNTTYTQQLTATGGTGAVIWAVSAGTLPPGLTLGPTSGSISGVPTAPGAFTFTVTATDSLAQTGSRVYALTVNGVLTISPQFLPNGTINTPYAQQLSVAGGSGAIGWAVTGGALPAGLTLNPSSGAITGTPTAAGTFPFTVTATDSFSQTGAQAFTLTVLNALSIAPGTIANGVINTPYVQQFTATGATGGVAWTLSAGALPAGLTLGPTSGAITGTPTASGSFTFTITATDSLTQTGSRAYTLLVNGLLTIAPPTVPTVYIGVPYSQTFTATGAAGAVTWAIIAGSGPATLPAGLTLDPVTGILSGTTNVPQGDYTIRVQATDAQNQVGQQLYTLAVRPPVTINPATLPNATIGVPYNQTLTAAGALGTSTFALTSGALPAGLTLASNGALTGTPTALGTTSFTVTVTTTQQQSATRTYGLTVVDPLTISTTSLPDGTEQEPYSASIAATTSPTAGFTWSITAGALPPGLTLAPATGAITGTPTNHGTYPFTAQVVTATGARASQALSIVIIQALSITSLSLGDATQGKAYTTTLTALGGRTPYTWSLAGTSLPTGLQLNTATGQITGTASAPEGSYPQNIVVTDSRGRTARRTLTLTISEPPPPSLAITPDTLPAGRVNQAYSATFSGSGGRPGYTFSLAQGSPPPGLSLSGATLSGTPSQDGTFRFTINVTDSQGRVAGNLYTVVIEPALVPLVVTPSSIAPTTQVGQPLTLQFGATGGKAPYTFAITGNLPPGTSSNSSGVLSGTPSQGGSFSFTVEATDATGAKSSRAYSLTVTGNLAITTQSPLPEGTVAKPYAVTFAVTGGRAPYTWSLTGNTPPGLVFDNGALTGTPTAAGTFSFSVNVQDSQRLSATAQFSVTIFDKVEITNAPADTALIAGQPFTFTFATRGGKPPVTLAVTGGALPAGLTMNSAGAISGTPTTAGSFAFTVQATDSLGNTAVQSAVLRVVSALSITTTTLPAGTVGTAYTASLAATGGVAPLGAWSISQGSLPAGLTLAADGAITGTPTAPGTASFTVRITDAAATSSTRVLSIAIQLPPVPPLSLSGLPQTLPPGAQNNITIQLAQPFPVPVTGTLTIVFEPNAVNNADDPSVQFSSGGRTVTFTIPAGQTAGTFPVNPLRLLSGTVAGTIRIRTTTSPESATPVPDTVVAITRSAPVITAGTAQIGTGTFTLTIDGFSNTREITSATFRLTPAAGSSLATTDVPVSVAATFTAYYQSAAAAPFGGQFRLVLPFTVNGAITDIDSVVVTVSNSVGASQPFTVRLR